MGAPGRIVLGSRGSELALTQARMVEQALRLAWPGLEVAIEIVRTSGDEGARADPVADRKAGRKGMFTREIEKELLVRRIDVAVHSAKDLPSEESAELEVRATLRRANIEDILVTRNGAGLMTMPAGATIATGSVRRQRQLLWKRSDLKIADLRGNVPTRLRKLRENENWSGIILARAGLERLGLEFVGRALRLPRVEEGQPALDGAPYNLTTEALSPEVFLPAGGQGVIALQVRRDDEPAKDLLEPLNHQPTHDCLRAEREFLRLLNGDCDSPVGVQAALEANEMVLRAQVFVEGVNEPKEGTVRSKMGIDEPEKLAHMLYRWMYEQK
ncbi:MAG TPA: hydroxymethylbilane synthase [Chthoniobacterales bacterium]|nr:hydroxymethylbilane synthase [Chthoniobacterales bacterium]